MSAFSLDRETVCAKLTDVFPTHDDYIEWWGERDPSLLPPYSDGDYWVTCNYFGGFVNFLRIKRIENSGDGERAWGIEGAHPSMLLDMNRIRASLTNPMDDGPEVWSADWEWPETFPEDRSPRELLEWMFDRYTECYAPTECYVVPIDSQSALPMIQGSRLKPKWVKGAELEPIGWEEEGNDRMSGGRIDGGKRAR